MVVSANASWENEMRCVAWNDRVCWTIKHTKKRVDNRKQSSRVLSPDIDGYKCTVGSLVNYSCVQNHVHVVYTFIAWLIFPSQRLHESVLLICQIRLNILRSRCILQWRSFFFDYFRRISRFYWDLFSLSRPNVLQMKIQIYHLNIFATCPQSAHTLLKLMCSPCQNQGSRCEILVWHDLSLLHGIRSEQMSPVTTMWAHLHLKCKILICASLYVS